MHSKVYKQRIFVLPILSLASESTAVADNQLRIFFSKSIK